MSKSPIGPSHVLLEVVPTSSEVGQIFLLTKSYFGEIVKYSSPFFRWCSWVSYSISGFHVSVKVFWFEYLVLPLIQVLSTIEASVSSSTTGLVLVLQFYRYFRKSNSIPWIILYSIYPIFIELLFLLSRMWVFVSFPLRLYTSLFPDYTSSE